MLIFSILLVAAPVVVILLNATNQSNELSLGYSQMLSDSGWELLAPLALGCALGVASALRGKALVPYAVAGAEVIVSGLFGWYFLSGTALPPHALSLKVGDPFPAYALPDQDESLRRGPAGPTLFIFYRGDW